MKIFFIAVLLFVSVNSFAEEDLFDIAARYTKQKTQVVDLEEKRRKTLADIYSIERRTNKIVLKKGELDRDRLKLDVEMKKISKKIVSLQDNLYEMTPTLIERLSVVEQMNNLPWFYTILTSSDLSELDQLFKSAKNINEKQAELIFQFLKMMTLLNDKKLELENTAKEILAVKKEIEHKEKQIEDNQLQKKKFLTSLEKVIKSERTKLKKIKGEGQKKIVESNLQELSLLFGTDFFDQKGKIPHPMNSAIIQGYGLNESLKEDYVQLLHKGFFYSFDGQERPRSIADGRVCFSGLVKGFGRVVVIDHGGRYYSTYGGLIETSLKKNDIVKSKQELGTLGYENLLLGRGLYFEIRHFSQPQNPANWLKKSADSLATL